MYNSTRTLHIGLQLHLRSARRSDDGDYECRTVPTDIAESEVLATMELQVVCKCNPLI